MGRFFDGRNIELNGCSLLPCLITRYIPENDGHFCKDYPGCVLNMNQFGTVELAFVGFNQHGGNPQNCDLNGKIWSLSMRSCFFLRQLHLVGIYLVGGFKHGFYFPFHIWDVILPIDELIFFKMVIAPPTSDVDISSGESNLPGEDFLDDALKYVLFGHAPWSKMIFFCGS